MNLPAALASLFQGAAAVPVADHDVWRIIGVDPTAEGTALRCTGLAGSMTVVVPIRPTAALAERWRRVMRVDRIDVTLHGAEIATSLSGVGHRQPSRRGVPVSIGLALLDDGVPGRLIKVSEPGIDSSTLYG